MNQQHHGPHLFSFQQRPHDSQQSVHQPRLPQHQQYTPQQHYQHQQPHPNVHPYGNTHSHTTQVLQQSRHQQQHHQIELPVLLGVNPAAQHRKGRWSPSEDDRLRKSIRRHGANKWKQVAKDVKTRSGDQCWKRWNDSLDPQLNHSQWQPFEDAILEQAVLRCGRMWSKIANENLPGRSGLSCKNRWDHIQRKQRRIHQSQREVLQGHSSSRSFLDSVIYSEQRRLSGSNDARPDSATGRISTHSRFPPFGEGFHRLAPTTATSTAKSHPSPLEHHHKEDLVGRNVVSSNGGTHLYKSVIPRHSQPRSFASLQSSSWGGLASQDISMHTGHHSSFSSPKTEVQPLMQSFPSSSPYPGYSLGSYVSQSSSSNASRGHADWLAAPPSSSSQPNSLLSVSEVGVCTGGMLTYSDDVGTLEESSTYNHQHHGAGNSVQDVQSSRTTTGFATNSILASAPDQSNPWPPRSSSILTSTTRCSYGPSQAALWLPKGVVTGADARAYSMTSFYSRQGSSQQDRMYDDREIPRSQQHYSAPTTTTSDHWKDNHEWQQHPASSQGGFSSTNACRAAKLLSSQTPFAYSTEEFATEVKIYSEVSHPTQQEQESRAGLETRDSTRPESSVGMPTASSNDAVDAMYQSELPSAHSTPRILKVEDMTHSMFYDDVQYRSHSRQPEGRYQDDEVTSDEEDSQQVEQGNNSGSASHHSATSRDSPLQHTTASLL